MQWPKDSRADSQAGFPAASQVLVPFFSLYLLAHVLLVSPVGAEAATGQKATPHEAGPAAPPAAIFVVRHAEKQLNVEDPSLTDAGRERAAELVDLLDAAGLDAIYSTQWRRTQETASPIASALGLEVETVPSDPGFEEQLAERLLGEHAGEVVLVVGHSNTNPELLEALGAPDPPTISEDDYDDVYLLVFGQSAAPRLIRLGYGRPTP